MTDAVATVIVTGASRGIGRAISRAAAELGFSVMINYVANETAAEQTVSLCEQRRTSKYQKFLAVKADVATDQGRTRIITETLSKFGRIDGLLNNPGIGPRVRDDITRMSEESFMRVMSVNLGGPLFLTQNVVSYWLSKEVEPLSPAGFKIVFITSLSAYAVSTDRAEYCISKSGLSMVSKLWAARLAQEGIQVFEVRPGIIDTDMTTKVKPKYDRLISDGIVPQKRWGKPEDVGVAVKSILAGNFPYSTGEVINVDGGFHIQTL